jgi:hypothetical protein
VSSLWLFLALLPNRLLPWKETGEEGNSASNIEESSLSNATHSSFLLLKTMVFENGTDKTPPSAR